MIERISRRTHEQWIELIQEQKLSTLSIANFCEQQGLGIHSFYYHKQKMNRDRLRSGFVEIHPAARGIRLRFDQDAWIVDVERDFDPVCMKQFLEVLHA